MLSHNGSTSKELRSSPHLIPTAREPHRITYKFPITLLSRSHFLGAVKDAPGGGGVVVLSVQECQDFHGAILEMGNIQSFPSPPDIFLFFQIPTVLGI